MEKQFWDEPIVVETDKLGQYVTIGSTERAAEYLLLEWPKEFDEESYVAAKQALLDAHEGRLTAADARDSFLAAVIEAGVFIRY
ncbi:MAG: DUF982 domain-containing protein [Rhizobiaceae bacterium]|nr:DUF982 domain-containing protein [Rhizobiaceae bacterium]